MYFLKLGTLVVGEYSSPLNGLSKLGVGLYSDCDRRWGTLTTAVGPMRVEGSGRVCLVQLRRAGPAAEARRRISGSGDGW
jgi:hypothetical protein